MMNSEMILDPNVINDMFGDMKYMIAKMQKEDYMQNFEKFETKYTTFFEKMYSDYTSSNSSGLFASDNDIPTEFFVLTLNNFKKFGKVRKSVKIDVSMYLIYYVFPLILRIEKSSAPEDASETNSDSILLSKALAEKWREISGNPKFNYDTYEAIKGSFVKTVFGFTVQ